MEQKYFRALWRWLWLIVLVAAVAGVGAYWAARNAPSTYEAEARLIVGPGLDSPVLDLDTLRTSGQLIHIYANVAQTPSFQQGVIGRLTLQMSEADLAESMDIVPFPESQVLVLRVEHSDPQMAIAIVNAAAAMLMERSPTSEDGTAVALMEQISEQAEDLEDDIATSKDLIQELEAELATVRTVAQQDFLAARIIEERRFVTDSNRALNDLYALMREPVTNQIRFLEPAQSAQLIDSAVNLKVMIGAMAGVVATVIPILGLAYYTDPIYTPHSVERAAGAPVLGTLSQPPLHRRSGRRDDEEAAQAREGIRPAETYRAIAAKLRHIVKHDNRRTILLTSGHTRHPALVGDVAASLAVALAETAEDREQILLFDAEPQGMLPLDLLVGVEPELAERGAEEADSLKLQQVSWQDRLSVATTGTDDAINLLGAVRSALRWHKQKSKLSIVAAPALNTSSNGLFIMPDCDGVVLVTESGVRREHLRQAAAEVTAVGGKLVGCILIQSRGRRFDLKRITGAGQEMLAGARSAVSSRMADAPAIVTPPVDEVITHD